MNEEMQLQIVALVQAAMSGGEGSQEAQQLLAQIQQAAQQEQLSGQPGQASLIWAMVELIIQQMQQLQQAPQATMARNGAKLNYIKQLRGLCPDGTELKYYKSGGRFCPVCEAKHRQMPKDPIEAYKCGKKIKKAQRGTDLPEGVTRSGTEGMGLDFVLPSNYNPKYGLMLPEVEVVGSLPDPDPVLRHRTLNLGPGYDREEQVLYLPFRDSHSGNIYLGYPSVRRQIFKTPYGNDTIYDTRYFTDIPTYEDFELYDSIHPNANKSLRQLKKIFYDLSKKAHPIHSWDKEAESILERARQGR